MNRAVMILDYGLGNILSVVRAYEALNIKVNVVDRAHDVDFSSPIIIPGVGAFPEAMRRLNVGGLTDALHEANLRQIPILGICLGMQVLFAKGTEHEKSQGLGFLEGEVIQLASSASDGSRVRLPSVGWRKIVCSNRSEKFTELLHGLRFYFVHSFCAQPKIASTSIAYYDRSGEKVTAFVQNHNIFGAQFHPEKSGKHGLNLLKAFAET